MWHSHPPGPFEYGPFSSENFSPSDRENSYVSQFKSILGAPSGAIKMFAPFPPPSPIFSYGTVTNIWTPPVIPPVNPPFGPYPRYNPLSMPLR